MNASISDVSFEWPSWSELVEVLLFSAGYNTNIVVAGTTMLGIAAGAIGAIIVLRRRALVGDAMAHCALPGLAAAFILGASFGYEAKSLPVLLFGAFVFGVLGIISIQCIVRFSRLHEDTAIGAVLSSFFGLGVVLMSVIQSLGTGEEGGLHNFIYGQTAAMGLFDAKLMLCTALFVLVLTLLLLKEFRLVCFDEAFAESDGWSVTRIDLIMMSLLVLVTVVGLQAVGLLLVVALLIIPATAARFWTERLSVMLWVSIVFGGLSGYLGSVTSSLLPRMPAGAVIVLISGIIFFLSMFFAPRRGLIAAALQHLKLSFKIAEEHLLRDIYEHIEVVVGSREVGASDLENEYSYDYSSSIKKSLATRIILLFILRLKGFIATKNNNIFLTHSGLERSKELIRTHRLWEEYLLRFAALPASHVDYSADLVEHVLSPEIVTELEARLSSKGLLPSVHSTRTEVA